MSNKFTIFTILTGSFSFLLTAQPDTILRGYPSVNDDQTVIKEALILSNNRILFTQSTYNDEYLAYLVDEKGEIMRLNVLDEVDGFNIFSTIHIIEDSARYIFVGNAVKDLKYYFITYSLDSSLENITLIDTIRLEDDTRLSFQDMKYNSDKSCWEAFGIVRRVSSSPAFIEYFYTNLNKDYTIDKVKRFKTKHYPNYVFEFYWMKSINRYIFSCFNNSTILVDENINFVYENAIRVSYIGYNGIPSTSNLIMYNCTDHENNTVFCYGKSSWNNPYNSGFVWLDIKADTIILSSSVPLAPDLGELYESYMRKDKDGNYIIAGTNTLPLGGGPPNTLKVVKYTPNLEKVWEFNYKDDKAFTIYDVEVDQKGDIVIVGKAWNMYGDGKNRGFLMKVYAHGTLSTYHEVPDPKLVRISPNPVFSSFCVRAGQGEQVQAVRFWDVSGRLALNEPVGVLPWCSTLQPDLPPGFYAAEVLFEDGRRSVQKIVVAKR